jgi:hypothetical protein
MDSKVAGKQNDTGPLFKNLWYEYICFRVPFCSLTHLPFVCLSLVELLENT